MGSILIRVRTGYAAHTGRVSKRRPRASCRHYQSYAKLPLHQQREAIRRREKDEPLRADIRLLGRLLGDTVREQDGADVFGIVERIRQASIRFHRDNEIEARRELLRATPHPSVEEWLAVTPQATLDLAASFQRTVIEELLRHAAAAGERMGARSLIVSGGVASNAGLRAAAAASRLPFPVHFPAPNLSTDNAAMIAAAAFVKYERREFADLTLAASASLTLAE